MKTRMFYGLYILLLCCALNARTSGWYLPSGAVDARGALSTARPDLHLRTPAEASYSGDNVYSVDGINQKKTLEVPANASATYLFRVQNDGNASDTFTVNGSSTASGWSVYYKRTDTGADITGAVTGAGWSTGALAPGAFIGLYVQVVPWFTLPAGAGKVISVTATSASDATKKDVVKTVTTVSTRLQPDLWIRKVPDVNFAGNNVWNLTAADQARAATIAVNTTVTYAFAVQNDGNTADTLTVTGPAGGNGWTVQYYTNAGANITASVTGSGWSTGVRAAGAYVGLYVKVTPTTATGGSVKTLLLTATSTKNASKQDVVKTETTVSGGPGTPGTNPIDGAALVWVPGGTFTMGSIDGVGNSDERPAHQVTLSGYWLYQYEVTVAQYRAFCAATSRALPLWPGNKYSWTGKTGWSDPTLQQHPIVNVSWYDAKAYADWAGVSLPTEAQWEYAARGPSGRNYPWGGTATVSDWRNGWDQTKCANFYNSRTVGKSTWPVGSFPVGVSWCGVHDLAGNVEEWCNDWHGLYSASPVTNPTGPASGSSRVLRGGSWNDYESSIRGAFRSFSYYPSYYWPYAGFRCAASVTPTIIGFNPSDGTVGTVVTITGPHLTGTTAVQFNGTAASFTMVSPTTLTATVPMGATTGPISVTTQTGTAVSVSAFTVNSAAPGTPGTNPTDGAAMVWVPGGTFTMGSITAEDPDEFPAHQVTLSGYWIYKYEVTVAHYRVFCAATSRALPPFPSSSSWDYSWEGKSGWTDPALQQHPIVNVTWNDANAYADWAGVSLPTEAQWEYAARGTEGRNFPWGGTATVSTYDGWDASKCANRFNSYNINKSTWPVGSFPAGVSWCGAHDLAGNVEELCHDWYGRYSSPPVTNPTGPTTGSLRVLRGGSWGSYYYVNDCRGANRNIYDPSYGNGNSYLWGFRCVSVSPGP